MFSYAHLITIPINTSWCAYLFSTKYNNSAITPFTSVRQSTYVQSTSNKELDTTSKNKPLGVGPFPQHVPWGNKLGKMHIGISVQ